MRFDRAEISTDAVRTTGAGALIIPAQVTRVGVFAYRNGDGSARREARLPDEVFSADTMASLEAAPLTYEHPAGPVTPETWKLLAVGSIDDPMVRGSFVAADVVINDADTIAAVKAGKIRELSCGYDAEYDPTPGEYLGEQYDGIQRNIRYNHVALTAKGRAGPEVRLLMDAEEKPPTDVPAKDAPPPAMTLEQAMAEIEALRAKLAQYEQAAADAAKPLQEKVDSLTAELRAMPERIRRDDAARAKAKIYGVRHDGQDTAAVMRATIKAAGKTVREDASPEYLAGAFDALDATPPAPLAPNGSGAQVRPISTANAARARMVQDSRDAHKGGK